jgi:RHS repeat-associated protein
MPGRSSGSVSYRYGFNGKESDDEVSGNGNSIHFEFREYDPRTGRFKSIDPLGANYPWQSPYVFAANNPIVLVDILGLGPGDPPTSTTVDANKKIEELGANLQQSEHFKNVSPEEFISQLTERINNPSGISQGEGTNFCWAAACASYVYEKNPAGVVEAMFSLYTTGTFSYDNGGDGFSFTPADYINDAAGSGTFNDNAGLAGNKVDQMLFMTLGARFKGYLNVDDSYDPGDESTFWASGNLGKAKDLWNAFGYDVKVSGSDLGWGASNKGGTVMTTLKSNDVVLFVNSPLFFRDNRSANWTGTHYIRVKSLSSSNGLYKVGYWDYGLWKTGKDARRISHKQFWQSTYGMIAIPW